LPYLHGLHLDAEDAIAVSEVNKSSENTFKVIVPRLPHLSNHTDFEPLRLHPDVECQYVSHLEEIPSADLIILPGSKNVGFDLEWLKSQGWEQAINKHLRYGGKVIGVCGGLQMLGKTISDPLGIEGDPKVHKGLALLDYETTLEVEKKLTNKQGMLSFSIEVQVKGYEIHAGVSKGKALEKPALFLDGNPDGAISKDNQILATYLHGLFDRPEALQRLLEWAGAKPEQYFNIEAQREEQLERLADAIEESLDMGKIILMSESND